MSLCRSWLLEYKVVFSNYIKNLSHPYIFLCTFNVSGMFGVGYCKYKKQSSGTCSFKHKYEFEYIYKILVLQ